MSEVHNELVSWAKQFEEYHLPTWEELPSIDFYMDQVIEYISKYVGIFSDSGDSKLITPAMINNYVKLGLVPPPVKKKYSKIHIANLLVITIIKQVTVISQIRDAMDVQISIDGGRGSYNLFCTELENSVREIHKIINNECINISEEVLTTNLAVKTISLALASKIIATKVTQIQIKNLPKKGEI